VDVGEGAGGVRGGSGRHVDLTVDVPLLIFLEVEIEMIINKNS
jgi:hypothetical protein